MIPFLLGLLVGSVGTTMVCYLYFEHQLDQLEDLIDNLKDELVDDLEGKRTIDLEEKYKDL